ncbi:hypothetical protein V1477_002724 [Vespula maculifrons]|uniref:Uncharacterized protein n=1 Tax=Vespula maculifrons TaxID=7453 RepID=A0ABD2CWV7_VESMC
MNRRHLVLYTELSLSWNTQLHVKNNIKRLNLSIRRTGNEISPRSLIPTTSTHTPSVYSRYQSALHRMRSYWTSPSQARVTFSD